MSTIFVKILHPKAIIPTRATSGSAGFDLHAYEDCEIPPQGVRKIRTGISIEIPKGYFGKIFDRSSLAIQQIITLGGIIDNDYRGELIVILNNLSKKSFSVKKFDKVAQLICIPFIENDIRETCKLSVSDCRVNGFGSSGK